MTKELHAYVNTCTCLLLYTLRCIHQYLGSLVCVWWCALFLFGQFHINICLRYCSSRFSCLCYLYELKSLIHFCHSIHSPWWPPSIFIIILFTLLLLSAFHLPGSETPYSHLPLIFLLVSPEDSPDPQLCWVGSSNSVQFFHMRISFTFFFLFLNHDVMGQHCWWGWEFGPMCEVFKSSKWAVLISTL